MLSKLAKKRIRRMADVVLANYKHFDMTEWARTNCTTVGCIAGLAVVEFAEEEWDTYEAGIKALALAGVSSNQPDTYYGIGDYIRNHAQQLLGDLTPIEGGNIFLPDNWPDLYETRRCLVGTQKGQARVASEYLTAIADGEVDISSQSGATIKNRPTRIRT